MVARFQAYGQALAASAQDCQNDQAHRRVQRGLTDDLNDDLLLQKLGLQLVVKIAREEINLSLTRHIRKQRTATAKNFGRAFSEMTADAIASFGPATFGRPYRCTTSGTTTSQTSGRRSSTRK